MKRKTPPSIHICLPAEMRSQLNAASKKRGMPAAVLIRAILAHYLAKGGPVEDAVSGALFE